MFLFSSRTECLPTDGEALQHEESSGNIYKNVTLTKRTLDEVIFLLIYLTE
jgi:hypothetical protein